MQRVLGRGRHDPADLRQRHVPRRRQAHDPRREVVLDDAVDVQRGVSQPDGELVQVEIVVADGDGAREFLQGDFRPAPPESNVGDVDGVVHRLIAERASDVEPLDPLRQAVAIRRGAIDDRHQSVPHVDRFERDRAARPFTVRFPLLLLHEPPEVPAVRVALGPDDGLAQPDLVDDDPARDEVEDAVLDLDGLDGHHLLALSIQRDVFETHPVEQVAAQPSDAQVPFQELRRLAHDVAAQPVLEPGRLRNDEGHGQHADEQRAQERSNLQCSPDRLHPSAFSLHPSAFILHPSSFILHPSSFQKACPMLKWKRKRRVSGSPRMRSPGIGLS
jgi:hypothetical protein